MQDILLLHGALGAQDQFLPLEAALQPQLRVHRFNFDGHGGRSIGAPFRIERFAREVADYIRAHRLQQPAIFGYSMGGYAALQLAHQQPELIHKIVTLGTQFAWSPESAAREVQMLDPDVIEEKVPKFAAVLQARHAPTDWREVLRATAEMMIHLGDSPSLNTEKLSKVDIPCLILRGELDHMVTQAASQQAADALPQGQFEMLSGAKHPIERVELAALAERMMAFLD